MDKCLHGEPQRGSTWLSRGKGICCYAKWEDAQKMSGVKHGDQAFMCVLKGKKVCIRICVCYLRTKAFWKDTQEDVNVGCWGTRLCNTGRRGAFYSKLPCAF